MTDKWEVKKKDGKVYGPADTDTLIRWIEERRVLADDLVSPSGKNEWKKAEETPPFREIFAPSIPKEKKKEEIVCPQCGKKWPLGTVLCTNCGTHLKTGKQLRSAVSSPVLDSSPLVSVACIKQAFRILKEKPWNLAGITLVFFLVTIIPQRLPRIGFLLCLIINPVITVGFYTLCVKKARGEKAGINTLFSSFSFFFPSWAVVVLKNIITGVAGFFLIIPGIFFQLALSFSIFLVGDERKGPVQAIKESFHLTQDLRWKIMAIFVLGSLLNIIGVMALGVGVLFTFPLTFLALATLYNGVKTGEFEEARKFTNKKEILIALLPVLLFLVIFVLLLIVGFAKVLPLIKTLPKELPHLAK